MKRPPIRRTPFQRKPHPGSRNSSFAPPKAPLPYRTVELPRGRGLRPRSKRQSRKERQRKPVRAAYMAAHPMCEFGACLYSSTDCHEPFSRARGGPIDDERNFAALCRNHHDWIHHHPKEATALGWLVPAWDGPRWLAVGGRDGN